MQEDATKTHAETGRAVHAHTAGIPAAQELAADADTSVARIAQEEQEESVHWLSSDERAAWLAIAGIMVKLPAALDAQLQDDAGLSFFEYMVLAGLSEREDRTMQMSELAAFSSGSLSRLSHAAKRLEAQGFLTREKIPGPGRRTKAILTQAGYDKVVKTAPGHVTHVRQIFIDLLTPTELSTLTTIGDKVLEVIGGAFPSTSPRTS